MSKIAIINKGVVTEIDTPPELQAELEEAWAAARLHRLQESIVAAAQDSLDTFARQRGYDGIMSGCTYKDSTIPQFAAEGLRCIELRDQTWATLYTMLAEVEAGTRPIPASFEDIAGDLPNLTWV